MHRPPEKQSYPYRRWIVGSAITWAEMRKMWSDLASGDPDRVASAVDEIRACLDDDGNWSP